MEGLEPPRLAAPDPKSGAAANYATPACDLKRNKATTLVPVKKERKFIDNSLIQ
jgi:hypothetical protein